jgi:hypothetical protein
MEMRTGSPWSKSEKIAVETKLRTMRVWPTRRAFLWPKYCYGTGAKKETKTAEK